MNEQRIAGSYLIPRAEHARVSDAMRHGLLECPAEASLRDAARMMCTKHVHMIVLTDPESGAVVGALSDMRLLDALLDDGLAERPMSEIAAGEVDTISSDAPLRDAALRMRERGSAHLLVRDPHSGHAVGVVSTLDIAGILAWGEA